MASVGVIHNSKMLHSEEESTSTYQDNAGRLFWGLSRSCSTAGCSYTNNCSMTKLSWLWLYHAVPLFLAIRKQAFFFPNIIARAEQKRAIRNVHLMRIGFWVGFMWTLKPDWMRITMSMWRTANFGMRLTCGCCFQLFSTSHFQCERCFSHESIVRFGMSVLLWHWLLHS